MDEDWTDVLPLSKIGYMRQFEEKENRKDPDCKGVSLDGEISSLKVSSKDGKVNAITFVREDKTLSLGELGDDFITETFTDKRVLFGLYGFQEEDEIKSIGFITLDPECLARLREPIEVEVEAIADSSNEDAAAYKAKSEAEPEAESETVNPIVFAIIGAIILLIWMNACLTAVLLNRKARNTEAVKKIQGVITSSNAPASELKLEDA